MSKFDVQHSDASFRHLSSSDLVDNVSAMESLSTYHKRNHYLLNNGAKGYKAPSWTDVDNIFPVEAPAHPMTHLEWAAGIRTFDPDNTKGDVLEYAIWYAQVSFGGAIFIWLVYIFSAIFRAIGDVITPAIVQIIGCFFQIIIAGTLTLGWFGFSSIGIIGPAVAMVICHFIMALYLMFNLQLKQKIITVSYTHLTLPTKRIV